MQISFSLLLARKYFWAKKDEFFVSFISTFSMFGIMIGVAALIIVMSVMNGFREELTRNIIGLNSDILISAKDNKIDNHQGLKHKVRAYDFVENAFVTASGQALAKSPKATAGVNIKGIALEDVLTKKQIAKNVIAGDLSEMKNANKIAIGRDLSSILRLRLGDSVKLLSPNTISTAFGSLPRIKDFTIGAIFASGLYEFDSAVILMDLDIAMSFLGLSTPNQIEVYTKNPDNLSTSFTLRNDLADNLFISNWQMIHGQFLNALDVERVVMFTILSLIVLVAAFNIISSLFMLVKDKRKDIAIFRTIGASKSEIMMIFIFNGIFIGFIGTIIGLLLGVGFALNIDKIRLFIESIFHVRMFDSAIYFLSYLPSKLVVSDVTYIVFISLSLSLLATIYPAYRAANMDPVEVLRYE